MFIPFYLFIIAVSFLFKERDIRYAKWKMAIARSLDWTSREEDEISKGIKYLNIFGKKYISSILLL